MSRALWPWYGMAPRADATAATLLLLGWKQIGSEEHLRWSWARGALVNEIWDFRARAMRISVSAGRVFAADADDAIKYEQEHGLLRR